VPYSVGAFLWHCAHIILILQDKRVVTMNPTPTGKSMSDFQNLQIFFTFDGLEEVIKVISFDDLDLQED
jgi:hypothetical protein